MTAIFDRVGATYRATEAAGGPWSPSMAQGSATTALLAREVETFAARGGLAVRRLTFDLWRPATLTDFTVGLTVLRDGRKAKTIEVGLRDGTAEIARCTALVVAPGEESPAVASAATADPGPESGSPPPAFAQNWSRYFQHVAVRLIEGALERPGPAAAWMRLDVPLVAGEVNSPLVQAVQAADFASGVSQIVDMRAWSFINPEISIALVRPPRDAWILVRARTMVGEAGAGLATATLADRSGTFAEVSQTILFERRAQAAQTARR